MTGAAFLQWALPQLHLRWRGFRRNHRQVVRRIEERRRALGLANLAAYREHLEATPTEWPILDGLCRVTISRFARDRFVWDALVERVFPTFDRPVRAWSAGCGAGEEPFTLSIAWQHVSGAPIEIVATDIDEHQLTRARAATFPPNTLDELPDAWRAAAFDGERVRDRFRAPVRFMRHDVRSEPLEGPFDLVLCRNLAFSYFDDKAQCDAAERFASVLRPEGVLVVGLDERAPGFVEIAPCIYRASAVSSEAPAWSP